LKKKRDLKFTSRNFEETNMSSHQNPRSTKTSMKRQRSQRRNREIGWTTALIVCVATLQSIHTVEYGDSFVFPTPPTTANNNALYNSRASTQLWAARSRTKSRPFDLTESPTSASKNVVRKEKKASKYNELDPGDDGYKFIMDHKILTMDEEYELGIKIRNYIDTKDKIESIVNKRHFAGRMQSIEERREKEVEKRKKRKKKTRKKSAEEALYEASSLYENDADELSIEKEFMMIKGQQYRSEPEPEIRRSIEELYGYYDDDEEEEMMEEFGMAVYGIDAYADEESLSNGFSDVDSPEYSYGSDQNDFSISGNDDSAQLSSTLDSIRLLTERDIQEELGIEGGRTALAKVMIEGALAKQELIKSNVRLVKSIAQKWMGTSKGSGLAVQNTDQAKIPRRQGGDWTTPAMDDVIAQGIYGLAIAAERFEPDRKFKFSTYATYYITNEVRKVFQRATTQCLYVPPYFYLIRSKYEKIVRENYRSSYGGKPNLSMAEIAGMLELKSERLEFILKSTQSLVELDASTGKFTQAGKAGGNDAAENRIPLLDALESTDLTPEQVVEQTLLRQCIENALAAELLPLERDVVRLRHGLDDGKSRTVKEVMQCSGGMLSVGDVRNLEQRAYKKLRFKHSVHAARLREFSEDYMGVSPELLEVY